MINFKIFLNYSAMDSYGTIIFCFSFLNCFLKIEEEKLILKLKKRYENNANTLILPLYDTRIKNFIDLSIKLNEKHQKQSTLSFKTSLNGEIQLEMEVFNYSEADCLIKYLEEQNNKANFSLIIRFEENPRRMIRYINYLQSKIEEKKINNAFIQFYDINYFTNYKYYKTNKLYYEVFNDEVHLISVYDRNKVKEMLKRKFDNEFLFDLLKININLYFDNLENLNMRNFMMKNFTNLKLIFLDSDEMVSDGNLLNETDIKPIAYFTSDVDEPISRCLPDMKCLNLLFYFLKDSRYLKKMVRRSLNLDGKEDYWFFKRIMKNLNISVFNGYEIFSSMKKNTEPISMNLNDYLIDGIVEKIKGIKLKDDIINYKRLLYYFYYYMKYSEKLEIDEVLNFINKFFFEGEYKIKNKELFKKLNQYICLALELNSELFSLNLNGEIEDEVVGGLPNEFMLLD